MKELRSQFEKDVLEKDIGDGGVVERADDLLSRREGRVDGGKDGDTGGALELADRVRRVLLEGTREAREVGSLSGLRQRNRDAARESGHQQQVEMERLNVGPHVRSCGTTWTKLHASWSQQEVRAAISLCIVEAHKFWYWVVATDVTFSVAPRTVTLLLSLPLVVKTATWPTPPAVIRSDESVRNLARHHSSVEPDARRLTTSLELSVERRIVGIIVSLSPPPEGNEP